MYVTKLHSPPRKIVNLGEEEHFFKKVHLATMQDFREVSKLLFLKSQRLLFKQEGKAFNEARQIYITVHGKTNIMY